MRRSPQLLEWVMIVVVLVLVVVVVVVVVGDHFIYNFVSCGPIWVKFVLNERVTDLVYIFWAEFWNSILNFLNLTFKIDLEKIHLVEDILLKLWHFSMELDAVCLKWRNKRLTIYLLGRILNFKLFNPNFGLLELT